MLDVANRPRTYFIRVPGVSAPNGPIYRIPGARWEEGIIVCPYNAFALMERFLAEHGVLGNAAIRMSGPALPLNRPVHDYLNTRELKDLAIERLVNTQYQSRGIVRACQHAGFALLWPAGCIAGTTDIIVNRGGGARHMSLADLVYKFNGGETTRRGSSRLDRWDLSIPTMAQSVDAEGTLQLNRIVAAVASGVKPTFRIQARAHHKIRATKDHHFLTREGVYAPLGELHVGDWIGVLSPRRPSGPREAKTQYKGVQQMFHHPYAVRKRTGKGGWSAVVAEHRLIVEADMNGMSLAEFVGRIVLREMEGLVFLDPNVHVHHRNEDPTDNRRENLEVLTAQEHQQRHSREGSWRHVLPKVEWTRIQSIEECNPEPTYDLTMAAPMNNFVANRFVVHNSGKTIAFIGWGLASDAPLLLVTKAAARPHVAAQAKLYTRHEPVTIEGETPERLDRDRRIFVSSYHALPFWRDEIKKLGRYSVVFDEVHGPGAKSFKRKRRIPLSGGGHRYEDRDNIASACKAISLKAERRLAASATILDNRPRDLWAPLDLIEPGQFGRFYQDFTPAYCGVKEEIDPTTGERLLVEGEFGGIDTKGSSGESELRDRISRISDYVPYEITHRDLPPKRREVVYLTPELQNRPEAGMARELRNAKREGASKQEIIEIMLAYAATTKRKYIVDRASEVLGSGGKAVIFTGRRADVVRLADEIARVGGAVDERSGLTGTDPRELVAFKHAKLWATHGDDGDDKRYAISQAFLHERGPAVFIATMDSCGEAIELQSADWQCLAMLPIKPSQITQVEGRCARRGQDRSLLVTYVISVRTIDEHVASMLLEKLPAVEKIIGDASAGVAIRDLEGLGNEDALMSSLLAKIEAGIAEGI